MNPNHKARQETQNFSIFRGVAQFDALVDGVYQGARDMGESSSATMKVVVGKIDVPSGRSGLEEVAKTIVTGYTAEASLQVENISVGNLALFFHGDITTVTQVSTEVADEVVFPVSAGLLYRLGRTEANPVGVAGVSVLTLKSKAGNSAVAYAVGDYVSGDLVLPSVANGYYYKVTTSGTATVQPSEWGTVIGGTTADGGGTAVFTCMGKVTLDDGLDYEADLADAEFSPLAGSLFADTLALAEAGADDKTILATYTPLANSRSRITPKPKAQYGSFEIRGTSEVGEPHTWFGPYCEISPDGDLPVISVGSTTVARMKFKIRYQKPHTTSRGADKLLIDGAPVGTA
jgi:hypothetical protein